MKKCGAHPGTSLAILKVLVFTLALSASQFSLAWAQPKQKVIAMTQIAEGSDLDDVRRGIIDAIKKGGFADAKINYENAQGDVGTAVQIAQRFAGISPDIIIAIGTPVAQAVVRSTKTIPVVFGGIGDPLAAGLVPSLEHPGGNATGTRAFTPVEPQLDLIKKVVPSAKRIGILNNPAEANSRSISDAFITAGEAQGYQFVHQMVTSSSETYTAAGSLVGKVDVIWLPPDNTIAASLESVVKIALSNKLPLFGATSGAVKSGAIGSVGLDWYQIGVETGQVAIRVLNGEKPGDIAIASASVTSLSLNPKSAKLMGIELPGDLMAQAARIVE
jgi:putative tryptophan/tyrosine transport system substrate-binding protein